VEERPESPQEDLTIRLGQKALERGWITPAQLREALAEQARSLSGRRSPRPLRNILLERGYLTDPQLLSLIEEETSIAPPAASEKKAPSHAPLGKYEIVRELGRGGMGVVYEATDTQLSRKVALKMLLTSPNADAREAGLEEERFLREARLSANLAKHPHIVSVYEAGVIEGRRYLAMELIEGQSFSKWKKAGSVTIRQQVKLLRDVAIAIHHAHQQGTIHRDLKPDNILVDAQNQPHVTDFGLAKSVGQNVQLSLTASGMIMGTPAYMSPEQALGAKSIDHRTDIYALGVMLYETLTGRLPFTGETAIEILMKASKNPVPLPSSVVPPGTNPTLDKTIENICLKALAKHPRDRYATAEALAGDLTRWLKGEEVQVRVVVPTRRKVLAREKSFPWLYALAGGAALLVLGWVFFWGQAPPVDPDAPRLADEKRRREAEETRRKAEDKGRREAEEQARAEIDRLKRERDLARSEADKAREREKNAKTEAERKNAAEDLKKAEDRQRTIEEDRLRREEEIRKSETPAPPGPGQAWIDLLPLIDPIQDALKGQWKVEGDSLISDANARILIPYLPPPEYDFRIVYRNLADNIWVAQELTQGGRGFFWGMAGSVMTAGFENVGGKRAMENSTTATGVAELKAAPPYTSLIQVRQGSVKAFIGGRLVSEWTPAKGELGWQSPPSDRGLGLDTSSAPTRFERIEVREVTGRGTITRTGTSAVDDAWIQSTGDLPPEPQVRRVMDKLKELNPGFDGQETHKVKDGSVSDFFISAVGVTDLSPIRGFTRLGFLGCPGSGGAAAQELRMSPLSSLKPLRGMSLWGINLSCTNVEDLSPLEGMKLTAVNCSRTKVTDLAPLRNMPLKVMECWDTSIRDLGPLRGRPLEWLNIYATQVSDLSPLEGMPLSGLLADNSKVTHLAPLQKIPGLKELTCDFVPARDTAILKSIRTLEKINQTPVAEFWKKAGSEGAGAAALNDPARWKNAINLMKWADPQKGAVKGGVKIVKGDLVPDFPLAETYSVFQFPYTPPEEYDFRITFTRSQGNQHIGQILRAGGRSFQWVMSWNENSLFGFNMIDGRLPQDNPSSVRSPACIQNGQRYVSTVQVRKDRVRAYLNGALVTQWKTNYADLSLEPRFGLLDDTALGLTNNSAVNHISFHSAEVLEVTGKGLLSRPGEPARGASASLGLGLVGYWKLNEGAGTTVADSSANKAAGKILAGAQWVKGKAGSALHFDGVNSGVELPNSPVLDKLQEGSYTASAWFMPDDTPPGKEVGDNSYAYAILMKQGYPDGLSFNAQNQFFMEHWLIGNVSASVGNIGTHRPGAFYQIAGVVDKEGGSTRIYVNGRLIDVHPWTANTATRDFGRQTWKIGIRDPGGSKWRHAAKGIIGSVRLYNRALGATEIQALHESESAAHEK
jgi:hypothetical protein